MTIGGLEGYVTDLTLADDYGGTCPYPGFEETPMVPLIIGVPPASLHHVVIGDTITRLYLLTGPDGQTIAIEVSDVPGGDSLDDVDAIVEFPKLRALLTELPQVSTLGILRQCSIDRFEVDLSTNRVAE